MFQNSLKLITLGGLALLVACSDVGDESIDEESMPQRLLASVELDGGGSLEFHEPMPGEMVAMYVGKDDDTYRAMFDDLERGALTHAAMYEALSGQKAPSALVEAEGRSIAARARIEAERPAGADLAIDFDAPQDSAVGRTENGIGTTRASLSAADFSSTYCPSGWGFLYCWTSRTGSGSVSRNSLSMYTYLNTYAGVSVIHQLEYVNVWGNWTTYVSQVVPVGSVSYISRAGLWTTRKASISQATGDSYHISIYGTN
jgi:hypothetical protein